MWTWWKRHPDDIQLQRLQEGLLSAGAARRLQAHVDACHQCQATLSAYSRLGQLLSHMPTAPMPLDLADQILDCVLAEQPASRLPVPVVDPNRLWGVAGGLFALLLAGLIVVWPSLTEPQIVLGYLLAALRLVMHGLEAGIPIVRGLLTLLEPLRYPALVGAASLTVLFSWLASRRLSSELSLPESA